jgi:hypothetical protein
MDYRDPEWYSSLVEGGGNFRREQASRIGIYVGIIFAENLFDI